MAASVGLELLNSAERDRLQRLQVQADRIAYAVAHGLLRKILAQRLAAPFRGDFLRGAMGKPGLPPPGGIEFNLTHSRGLVAVAVCRDVPVGVDVEDLSRPVDSRELSWQVLSDAERVELGLAGWQSSDFLRHWVMKEALSKAAGQGLQSDFRTLTLSGNPLRIVALPQGFGETASWSTDSVEVDTHLITVAARHSAPVWCWHAVSESLDLV